MKKWLLILFIVLLSGCIKLREDVIPGLDTGSDCEDSVVYTDWTACDSSGTQARFQVINYCNGSSAQLLETKTCVPTCQTNWTCTSWGDCKTTGFQYRTCTDSNACYINKPSESQTCTFVNPCNNITSALVKAKCTSIVYENYNYCQSTLSVSEEKDNCLYNYANFYRITEPCNLINDSYNRNVCKATSALDRSYCNILAPEYRSDCNTLVDYKYLSLASENFQTSYCSSILDSDTKNACLSSSNYNYYSTYKDTINDCNSMVYEPNVALYQTVRACYVYHISNTRQASMCASLPSFIKNDCTAMINRNLTHCYDLSGSERDWCLANMAYYYNDITMCREATSIDNCFYTIGYWFKEPEYCDYITDVSIKSSCKTAYVNFCQTNFYNCYPDNYCELITGDNTKKDTCIYNRVVNEIILEHKEW